MLDRLLKGSAIVALLAVATLAFQLQTETIQRQRVMDELAYDIYAQNLSLLYTQKAVRDGIATAVGEIHEARVDLRNDFSDAAAQLAGGLVLGVGTLNYQIERQVGGLQMLTDYHLSHMEEQLQTVAGPAGQVLSQASDAMALSLNCEHNPDCLHNRWVGTARAVEKAATAWGEAAPRQAQAVTAAAENAAAISASCPFLRKIFLGCRK